DDDLKTAWFSDLIRRIKSAFGIAVTLSVGERSKEDYAAWRDAGADRYLLKIETSEKKLYQALHPGMSFERRLQALDDLRESGYQVGSGVIVGLRGQDTRSIARDIIFLGEHDFDMIGIGPFISHQSTPLAGEKNCDAFLALKTLALTRIVTRNAHLPATTALGSLGKDFRVEGLRAGANVLMPNFTPAPYRKLYEIYPGKRCVDEPVGACASCMELLASSIERHIEYSRGDTLKPKKG
ncbi:MAG: radical SAM protein, partial [Candidatus Omnitrophica bacterium]|nr:radical SAM protein [Candidatus Omnitrophota bacterium]